MTRQFKILFSFKFTHDYYLERNTEDFVVVPTSESLRLMKNHDLFFKRRGDKFIIIYQNLKLENGDKISRIIEEVAHLTFFIRLKNSSLNSVTDYTNQGAISPPTNGRKRVLFYFSNLNATATDMDLEINSFGEVSLSKEPTVTWNDLIPISPFVLKGKSAGVMHISKACPLNGYVPILSKDLSKEPLRGKVDLKPYSEGLYKISLNGDESICFISEEAFLAAPFGVIDIYLDKRSYRSIETQYFIEFLKKKPENVFS